MIRIKRIKKTIILSVIMLFAFGLMAAHNVFKVYATSSKEAVFSVSNEKRGTPAFDWMVDKNMMPHMKVFFWVPKGSSVYIPFADKSVKSYISRHGSINKWYIHVTGKSTKTEREVYLLVPKSFVLLHGTGFYKLIHIEVVQKA